LNKIANREDYHILISVDKDDQSMFPLPVLDGNHTFVVGNSKNKIDAINRDTNEFDYDFDILINMSDDMIFTKKGFDDSQKIYHSIEGIGGEFRKKWE
jgi:hypothetical protein